MHHADRVVLYTGTSFIDEFFSPRSRPKRHWCDSDLAMRGSVVKRIYDPKRWAFGSFLLCPSFSSTLKRSAVCRRAAAEHRHRLLSTTVHYTGPRLSKDSSYRSVDKQLHLSHNKTFLLLLTYWKDPTWQHMELKTELWLFAQVRIIVASEQASKQASKAS